MDSDDGSWAVLYGAAPLSATSLDLAVDEDQIGDSERRHNTEQVAYLVFEQALVYPEPVVADFYATPLSGTVPLTVTLVNSSTGASSYLWDYGDRITSTASAVTHTHAYTATGVYTVSLTASGPGGSDTLTRTNYITVSPAVDITYVYDPLYRLVTATYSTGEFYHYTYDPVGNRLSLTTTVGVVNYQYDAANRLTSVNGQAYTWDNNGNLLNDGLRSYTYDHANRLTQVVSGTLTTEFVYDGYLPNHIKRANELLSIGNRVRTVVDGQATDYVMDVASPLPQVLVATTGGQSSYYLHGADLIGQYDSGTWAYHLPDALGSVRSLTDPMGQVFSSYSFSPFGVPTSESGGDPYGFTGEWWESRAELLYLRARYYQPETGRFVTEDPFPGLRGQPQTQNWFVYVTNNPVNRIDPEGLYGKDVHHDLTFQWAAEAALRCRCDQCMAVVHTWLIAEADLWTDDLFSGMTPAPGIGQPERHFLTRAQAMERVDRAIESRKVWEFGIALHQLQDTFSHWEEGYTLQSGTEYGHGYTGFINWLRQHSLLLNRDDLAELRDGLVDLLVQKGYPRWYVETLSDGDVLDLWLREYTDPHDPMRRDLGYNTDLYSPWSGRDMDMEVATRRALKKFFTFGTTRCDIGKAPQGGVQADTCMVGL
jgi:RHS repeat-associated protein